MDAGSVGKLPLLVEESPTRCGNGRCSRDWRDSHSGTGGSRGGNQDRRKETRSTVGSDSAPARCGSDHRMVAVVQSFSGKWYDWNSKRRCCGFCRFYHKNSVA